MAVIAYRRTAQKFISDSGAAVISGVVRVLTNPVARPVYLLDQGSLRVVRTTRSASNGTYSFSQLEENRQWLVLSIDETGAYNAVVADRVTT